MNGSVSNQVAWPAVISDNSLSLSQNAVVINAGSSANIFASNSSGSGALYVSNNSNPAIANVSISGTTATISGNIAGSTTITLCQVGNATTNCPGVYVIVEQAGTGQLSFSQTSPTVVISQNLPITINGGNGSYLVKSNSKGSTIQASISGSVLTLSTGAAGGSSTITICSSDMAMCGVVIATVGSVSSVTVTFNTNTPTVAINQTTAVNVYGPAGVQFYVSSNSNPGIVQANLSGATLTLTGIAAGSSTITICASTGTCNSLTVTVQYSGYGTGPITLSQNTLSLTGGQSVNITISGGTQPYNISGGTSSVSQESLSGNVLNVQSVGTGASSVDVCSAGGACLTLLVTVNGGTASTQTTTDTSVATPTVISEPILSATPAYVFSAYLSPGERGADVLELQKLLASGGFLSAEPNGYYGAQTKAAVIKFQAAHGINKLGVVGPATRDALNLIENSAGTTTSGIDDISSMTMPQLQARLQSLQTELSLILSRIAQLKEQGQ